ncbi:hypothetical protein GGX14DRAFT_626594 [Mycena pura]|uniref:Uncharacterized protein n=1 Tax=Mycena pura TaxID=153505 RepID=A0AAD6VE53_9AGAR|nr:hypothetical protein GGX14DRAFT_626594 [Mycena pura]
MPHLPDETISEILSPALSVPDDAFSDNSLDPFATYSESSSAYLLVCKSWLRVATPLLYNVVVLRSKAQAKALAHAVSKNNVLGLFMKKLRVEGGYGQPMYTILKCAPNVSDLYLSFDIFAPDSTDGLCRGLHLINPIRLILRDKHFLKNKMVLNLVHSVTETIPKWDRLSVLHWPYDFTTPRFNMIAWALVQANRLHTIFIESIHTAKVVYEALKECPLRQIHIQESVSDRELAIYKFQDQRLTALVQYTKKSEKVPCGRVAPDDQISQKVSVIPSLNPHFTPMRATSKAVQDAIWSRVLYFAMTVPERVQDPTFKVTHRGLHLLLVSKTFHRLGLPHYYAHIKLDSSLAASNLAFVLSRRPSLAPNIKVISASGGDYSSDSEYDSDTDPLATVNGSNHADRGSDGKPCADPILAVLSQTNRLRELTSQFAEENARDCIVVNLGEIEISWPAFVAMAKCSGSVLRECSSLVGAKRDASPTVFNDLVELRKLYWRCDTTFSCNQTDTLVDALPNLEDLHVLGRECKSFLTVLSMMRLTSLRRVSFFRDFDGGNFLQVHGSRLSELEITINTVRTLRTGVLEYCPNLISLTLCDQRNFTINGQPPDTNTIFPREPAALLTEVRFLLRHYLGGKDVLSKWEQFFMTFSQQSHLVPNLRSIQSTHFVWPTSEHEISKSGWVRVAESLLAQNICMMDETGKKWRARLGRRTR